jgi:hypothetical protein
MSSKRVRRDIVNLVTPDRSESMECERLRKEVNYKNEVCLLQTCLILGYYIVGGFCETDAEGIMLWCLYGAALPTVQPQLWTRILLFGMHNGL